LEAGASDFAIEDEVFEIYTEPSDLYAVRDDLTAKGYTILSAEEDKIPSSYVTLEDELDIKHMNLLLESLEDDDDVQDVYHNWENA
jgi:transcriptional/translational regulatory protein YebC/TACO1